MSAPRPRSGILEISPYVGGKAETGEGSHAAKLSANENALGPSPRAVEAYRAAGATLHRYPDGGSAELRRAIGRRFNIEPGRIVCGAGSDEIIGLLTRAYAGGGDEVLYSAHGFLMYRLSALAAGATPVAAPEKGLRADVDALLAHVTSRTRIVYLANPWLPGDPLACVLKGLGGLMMAEALAILAFCDIYTQFWLKNLGAMHRGWASFTVAMGIALTMAGGMHLAGRLV